MKRCDRPRGMDPLRRPRRYDRDHEEEQEEDDDGRRHSYFYSARVPLPGTGSYRTLPIDPPVLDPHAAIPSLCRLARLAVADADLECGIVTFGPDCSSPHRPYAVTKRLGKVCDLHGPFGGLCACHSIDSFVADLAAAARDTLQSLPGGDRRPIFSGGQVCHPSKDGLATITTTSVPAPAPTQTDDDADVSRLPLLCPRVTINDCNAQLELTFSASVDHLVLRLFPPHGNVRFDVQLDPRGMDTSTSVTKALASALVRHSIPSTSSDYRPRVRPGPVICNVCGKSGAPRCPVVMCNRRICGAACGHYCPRCDRTVCSGCFTLVRRRERSDEADRATCHDAAVCVDCAGA